MQNPTAKSVRFLVAKHFPRLPKSSFLLPKQDQEKQSIIHQMTALCVTVDDFLNKQP